MGLENDICREKNIKQLLDSHWLWMCGPLIFYFDFCSQINNSECFKAFLLSFNAQHFSASAHINIDGSSHLRPVHLFENVYGHLGSI